MKNHKNKTTIKNRKKDFVEAIKKIDKKIFISLFMILGFGLSTVYAQDFSGTESKLVSFMQNFQVLLNVAGAAFCLFFIIRIAMAYWGGGEEGRQDAGGMIKKLLIGIGIWIIMYQVIEGIFGVNFSK